MDILALRTRIDSYAAGPDGTPALLAAMARPSPVDVICTTFEALRGNAATLEGDALELLRDSCTAIIGGQWHGKAADAATVLASLPPPPPPPAPPQRDPLPEVSDDQP